MPASTVTEYLAALPPDRGDALSEVEILERLIRGELIINPIIEPVRQIGPASIDIRLGFEFYVLKHTHRDPLTEKEKMTRNLEHHVSRVHVGPAASFVLHPGEFVLAGTLEYFRIPQDLVGWLEGRSSWGRRGLQVATARCVAQGFEGILTLELQNTGQGPLRLFPGVRIAQMRFFNANRTAVPYPTKKGAKY